MDTQVYSNLNGGADASLSLTRQLRDLYRTSRLIQHHDPYAAARVARIADQAEYFLQQWPSDQWPSVTSCHRTVPTREVTLTWLASVKAQAHQAAQSGHPWAYASWRQTTSVLLDALVAFA